MFKKEKGRKNPNKKSDKKAPHRFNFGWWYSLAVVVLSLLHDRAGTLSFDFAYYHITIAPIF